MILGFKDQFVPFVEDGSKTHTIRAGERWKVGMRADLFARPRQKGMRLIFRAMVTKVEPVAIWEIRDQHIDGWPRWDLCPLHKRTMIRIGFHENAVLSTDELNFFAWRDGFRAENSTIVEDGVSRPRLYAAGCFDLMVQFWAKHHGFGRRIHRFEGQIIYWDYAQRFMRKDGGPDMGRDSGKSRELHARGETAGDIAVPDTRERLCDERRTVIRRDSRERPA